MVHKEIQSGGNYSESWMAYRDIIKPHMNVAVIGPSTSPFIDPTLLYVSNLMARGDGSLVVIDPKNDIFREAVDDPDITRRIAGDGNFDSYKRFLLKFKELGIDLKEPEYVEGATATNMLIEQQSLDVLADHATGVFLVTWSYYQHDDCGKKRKEILYLVNSYKKYLKPEGQIILQTNNGDYGFCLDHEAGSWSMISIMEEAGLEVEYHHMSDRIVMPMDRKIHDNFRSAFPISGWQIENNRTPYVLTLENEGMLIIEPARRSTEHPSPDMYIAGKRSIIDR